MSKLERIRLAVGVPAYGGQLSANHLKMWIELGSILNNSPERFELASIAFADINGVDRARNHLIAQAMIAGADWLLMIDADTWVESGDPDMDAGFMLLRMISEAEHAGASVVAAPVIKRGLPGMPSEIMAYQTCPVSPEFPVGLRAVKDLILGMSDVDAAATAVFATNLHKVNEYEALFKFTDMLSEDLEFCRQIKAGGGRILVDNRVRTGHMSRSVPMYSRS